MKATQLQAHDYAKGNIYGTTKRLQILAFIRECPGCTRNQIARTIPGMTINCASGRVAELLMCGALVERGVAVDQYTRKPNARLYVRRKAK